MIFDISEAHICAHEVDSEQIALEALVLIAAEDEGTIEAELPCGGGGEADMIALG